MATLAPGRICRPVINTWLDDHCVTRRCREHTGRPCGTHPSFRDTLTDAPVSKVLRAFVRALTVSHKVEK
jgi:hypothetical protein